MSDIKCDGAEFGDNFSVYQGDCVSVAAQLPDECVGFSVYSPPFNQIFTYSPSVLDMGNCSDDIEFIKQYGFLIKEIYRITKPGRLTAVHCSDLPSSKWKDGVIGLKDFPGDIVRAHQAEGWIFHSRVCVWRDPVVEMTRTKALGLLYKQLKKDSTRSRMGIADYVLVFRKPGDNASPVEQRPEHFPVSQWQKWASPVWMDINQTNTLNVRMAKDGADEKHLCLARDSRVLTKERGYVPIQDVIVGEHAFTHLGRWRRVLAVQNTGLMHAITVRAQGVPGITLTPDHKLWMRKSDMARERFGAERAEPTWIESETSVGGYVNFKLPKEEPCSTTDPLIWWIAGRWIADGHWDSRGAAIISCGKHEIDNLSQLLGDRCGGSYEVPTGYQIRILDRGFELRSVLTECGSGAANKHLPSSAFTLPYKQAEALLAGYLSGDGHFREDRRRWMASSVSRDLLLGISALAHRVHGAIASVYAGRPARESEIEGRSVKCKQDWILSFDIPSDRYKSPFILDDGAWKKVRSIEDAGQVETWNIRVEEDESYTAEGCIVKNCPLQLDLIERAVTMWSNPGDVVLSPFMGIGSEGVVSLKLNRKFLGIELKPSYFNHATRYLEAAERQEDLFRVEMMTAAE